MSEKNIWVTKDTIYNEMIGGIEVIFKPISRKTKLEMASSFEKMASSSTTKQDLISQDNKIYTFLYNHIISIDGFEDQDKKDFIDIQEIDAISILFHTLMQYGTVAKEAIENLDSPSKQQLKQDSSVAIAENVETENASTNQEPSK